MTSSDLAGNDLFHIQKGVGQTIVFVHGIPTDYRAWNSLEGIMNRKGAFEQFPESVRAMMKDNARTVAELDTKLPNFTKEDARRILVPTLLVNGVNSSKFFHTIVDVLGKAIPRSETVRISDSAHFPHVENPEEFNKQLLNFLAKNG